jgi:hypothetical protein
VLDALWEQDVGATLRDVYVPDASDDDWQRAVDAIRATGWPTVYSEDHVTVPMPADVRDVRAKLANQIGLLWQIEITESVTVNGHFFYDEIEFNIAPGEISDQRGVDAVCEFMRVIGQALQSPVWVGCDAAGPPRPPTDMHYDPKSDSIVLDNI